MIVQAEHIPVHLGAMPEAVAAVLAHDPAPGDLWALNDPYAGGTHLPDLTLVSAPLGFAVTRAHHADVGGSEPGSLPAGSTELADEGLIIPPTRLDDEALGLHRRHRAIRRSVSATSGRSWRRTARRTRGSRSSWGAVAERVVAAMDELLAYAERGARRDRGASGRPLRGGRPDRGGRGGRRDPRRRHDRRRRRSRIDFEGTAPQYAGNLNCPLSVTRSACFFVVRCPSPRRTCSPRAAPSRRLRFVRRRARLVNARPPAAVVAGNTETSSRITDVVFAAFGRPPPLPAQRARGR